MADDPDASPAVERLFAIRRWAGLDQAHQVRTVAGMVVAAALLGDVAGWLLADFGLRTPAFVGVALGSSLWLYRQPNGRAAAVRALSALAVLLALTPLFLNLPFVLAADRYGIGNPAAFVLRTADLVALVVFLAMAAVPAAAAWWLARDRTAR